MNSLLAVLVAASIAQVDAKSFEEHKWRDGIQVWQSSRKGREIMWGRCNGWFHKLKSCILPPDTTCAAHLSEGPEDADVEVRLGNLPVFAYHPTYVQWWAARKSEDVYDPLKNPENATVFDDMFKAYPRFYDSDFNGGNLQIDANGEAVIRFRAPATHKIGKHARIPHVHIRICSSGRTFSIILGRRDKVQLTANGPVAKSECNTEENKIHVLNYRSLRPTLTQELMQRGLSWAHRAWENVDLDALEFSPVFQCLSSKLLYDHIEGDCADSCPEGSVLTHGQCVKPASSMQSFSAMWDLQVCGCDERCWADKRDKTIHRLRLEIAEHMDIPLHEVHELDISFMSGENPEQASIARMHIHIQSPRHTLETGSSMLRSLFFNMERSSEVLAMLVLASREVAAHDVGFLHKRVIRNTQDVYLPYYHDLDIVKQTAEKHGVYDDKVLEAEAVADNGLVANPWNLLTHVCAPLLCCIGLAAVVLKCICAQKRIQQQREPQLRHLGQPLANPDDPVLFTGGQPPMALEPVAQPPALKQQPVIGQYLATVYARAARE